MMPVKVKSEVVVLSSSTVAKKQKSKLTPLNAPNKDCSIKLVTPTSAGSATRSQRYFVPPGSLTPVVQSST